ncbi:hypothetical protein [Paenibacillus sp. MMO-58]|uniref:hypothetical protein n=1 Tax=Paenibacillus sp. MMO-58 TaxID=3081290 RepID=UPI003FA6EA4F
MSSTAKPAATAAPLKPAESMFNQPIAVWAIAFASIIAFMGLGLVDPILPMMKDQLHASDSDLTLLFTSYNAVMAVAMLVTGAFGHNQINVHSTCSLRLHFVCDGLLDY